MRRRAGFTLIEVLIAFVIAALGIAIMMQSVGTGLLGADQAARYAEAAQRAQSHLAEIGVRAPLTPGTQQGEDGDRFAWTVVIAAVDNRPAARGASAAALYRIDVSVAWATGSRPRAVTLTTFRIGPPPQGERS